MKRTSKKKRKRKTRDGGRDSIGWKVWNKHNPDDPILPDTGYVIHHKDEDPFNNDISNLQKMTDIEHKKYHTSNGRHPNQGKKFSKKLRKKLSEAHKGQKAWNKGKKVSKEERLRLIKIREKSSGFSGKEHSKETKKKISKANEGNIAWNKGKKTGPRSEETKRKISEKMKKVWNEKRNQEKRN